MLDQPYKYITDRILGYFQSVGIKPGDKYNLFIENQEDLRKQYKSFSGIKEAEEFAYIHPKGNVRYSCISIEINGVKLIISETSKEATEGFQTTLRNEVAAQSEEGLKNTAILILFGGNLDSILGGAGSLLKEGMPLHPKFFKKNIQENIQSSNCEEYEKRILTKVLSRNYTSLDENESAYDLRPVIRAIADGKIDKDLYHEFGLFPHEELKTKTEKIDSILESNFDFFENIEYVFRIGSPEIHLDKYVSEKGKDHLTTEKWDETDFSQIEKWNKELKTTLPPPVITDINFALIDNVEFWKRPDDDKSVAKRRLQNIIVFNVNETKSIECNVEFDRLIKKNSNTKIEGDGIGCVIDGKTIRIKLENGSLFRFVTITDKDSNKKYELRFLILPFSSDVIESIEGNFIIRKAQKALLINAADKLELNYNADDKLISKLQIDKKYVIDKEQGLCLNVDEDIEEELIPFSIEYEDVEIPFQMKQETDSIPVITGLNIWKDKREFGKNFKLKEGDNKFKLVFQNKEYGIRELYKSCLKLEKQIIKSNCLSWNENSENKLVPNDLDVNAALISSFSNIVEYYKQKQSIPSLLFIDKELDKLVSTFLDLYINELDNIEHDKPLTKSQKDLFWIGIIIENFGEEKIKFTPLHPVNLAYQLTVNNSIKNEKLYTAIIKRLNSNNLIPYIKDFHKRVYAPVDNYNIPEWTFYSKYLNSKLESPKQFVKPLISSKIKEFTENFKYLFGASANSPIKINLINLGVCKEVVEGIFEYYRLFLNKKKDAIKDLLPIDVYIYGSDNLVTKFEEISFYNSVKEIHSDFDITLKTKYLDEDDLLGLFQEKVHFYRKSIPKKEEDYEYSHITFHQFSRENINNVFNKMADVKSGVSLNGLISDVPSVREDEIYKTGFGLKDIDENKNTLLKVAKHYNSLANSANEDSAYLNDMSLFTTINMSMKEDLEKLYERSQWVTFIDPKVNLDFFKAEKDLVIVHYSDQYTNSTSFDAITVTNKSKQYQQIVDEFLTKHSVKSDNKDTLKVINLFNAINGDWLLKLISAKSEFPREKISLLSGLKAALSLFHHECITWVPISIEEILRVSGGAGLSKEEGLFSVKNLGQSGSYSDDLLMIGFEEDKQKSKLYVYFYPLELKIGNKNLHTKGKLQGKRTAELLDEHLFNDKFRNKFYKNFFISQAILTAEKLLLYGVGQSADWDLISNNYRKRLRNDEFEVSNKLKEHIGDYGIIHFEKDNTIRSYNNSDDHVSIKLCEEDGYNFLIEEIDNLKHLFLHTKTSISTESLLYNLHKCNSLDVPEEVLSENKSADTNPEEINNDTITNNPSTPTSEEFKILFGSDLNRSEDVYWCPTETDKVMHTNTGIIGTMGTGKTQFTKSLITQIHSKSHLNVKGKDIGILIFDYKGDYIKEDFVNATKAQVYDLYHLPYNPLCIDVSENPRPMLPMHTANSIKETITKAFGLGNVQQQKLKTLLIDAYEEKGIIKNKSETWSKPAPTMQEVCSMYIEDPKSPQDSLFAALSSLADFEIFEPNSLKTQSLYNLLEGVTVINLSGYSPDIQNLVVAITLDLFYNQMQINGHSIIDGSKRQLSKMILVDEADNFLSKDFESIKKILKEGREFGVGTILSTQFLNHFSTTDNDYSNYILTWIVHRVNEIKTKEVESLFNLSTKEQKEDLVKTIKNLEKHTSIVNLSGSSPIMIRDKAFWELLK